MKKEDYEKQIEELNEQALRLEKTMLTYRNLERCKAVGHELIATVDSGDFSSIGAFEITCNRCGANVFQEDDELVTDMRLGLPSNPELFGDLAGLMLEDIDIEIPEALPETTETDEKPIVPVENAQGSGTYKVDTSDFFKGAGQ